MLQCPCKKAGKLGLTRRRWRCAGLSFAPTSLLSRAQEIRAFLEKPDEAGLTDMASKMLESDPELQAQMLKIQEAMAAVDKCASPHRGANWHAHAALPMRLAGRRPIFMPMHGHHAPVVKLKYMHACSSPL